MARKAKTPKYNEFNSLANGFGRFQAHSGKLNDWLDGSKLMLEVGCGRAEVGRLYAKEHTNWQVIGLDRKSDRLWKANRQAQEDGIQNIAFVQTDMRQLADSGDLQGKVDIIWVTFPDPYPRKGNARNRLTHEHFLQQYLSLLKPGGEFRFKTDNARLFAWSLEQLEANKNYEVKDLVWDIDEPGEVVLPSEALVMTKYEKLFRAEGSMIHYLSAVVNNS